MPLESRPPGSSSECFPEPPRQHLPGTEHASTRGCMHYQLETRKTDDALPDINTSTMESSDTSDSGLQSETDHHVGGEDTPLTEYEDSIIYNEDMASDDEGFDEPDTASTTTYTAEDEDIEHLLGRQYSANHWEPNDCKRQEMWNGNHHVCVELLGGLHKAAIPQNCERVLDVGTGTGIWAMAFADKNPHVRVIGIDISPIAPNLVPPNLEFQIDDFNLRWTFEESFFGYIHARDLNGSIDRRKFTKDVFKALAPGGVAEFHERPIGLNSKKAPLTENSYLYQWGEFFREVGERRGRPFLVEADGALRQAMETAGFERIEEYKYEIPIGEWPESDDLKRLGKFALMDFNHDIEGSMLRLATEDRGWSEESTHVFAAALREEMRLASDGVYAVRNVVVGVRPS